MSEETSRLIRAARSPYWNQGNATPIKPRTELRLIGLLPPAVETKEIQIKRALTMLRSKETKIEKYLFLAFLRNTNTRLFYSILLENITEIAPLIYTPVVGEACQKYSMIHPFLGPAGNPDGLFISINDLDRLDELINNYKAAIPPPFKIPEIAVVTDGSRILGLGDLGVNGMGIPVGKLQLYSGAAGINPSKTLPITLDFGTNTDKYMKDEFYLGLRQKRPDDNKFYESMDKVMVALKKNFPDMLVQFEDFSSEHAFGALDRYRNKYFCFNDDIQGTGAVILAGYINAVKYSNTPVEDQKIVFFGAGSAGVGVAKQIMVYFIKQGNLSEKDAKKKFWLVDSKGLITQDRDGELEDHKKFFARDDNQGRQYKTLEEIINYVNPSALIGLSSVHNAFTPEIIKKMANINNRPIIFPLSNPADKAETDFKTALKYTENRVLFASGTAFEKEVINGKTYYPNQGNNFYIFPGLGYGCILAKPKIITDDVLYRSALGLSTSLTEEEEHKNLLYPEVDRIRKVSAVVAAAVIEQCVHDNLTSNENLKKLVKNGGSLEYTEKRQWKPDYKESLKIDELYDV